MRRNGRGPFVLSRHGWWDEEILQFRRGGLWLATQCTFFFPGQNWFLGACLTLSPSPSSLLSPSTYKSLSAGCIHCQPQEVYCSDHRGTNSSRGTSRRNFTDDIECLPLRCSIAKGKPLSWIMIHRHVLCCFWWNTGLKPSTIFYLFPMLIDSPSC